MTSNQVNNKRVEAENANAIRRNANESARNAEYSRANRAQEKLKREDQRIQKVATAGKIVNDAFGNLVGGAKAIGTFANDPSWYNLNKQLVIDAASISFHTPLSEGITRDSLASNTKTPRASVVALAFQACPGIGGYDSNSRFSASGIYNSVARVASQNIYAWVRHANSGASNYEPSDLMMYLLALDQAYIIYAWGRSIYRMANSFLNYNFTWLKDMAQLEDINLDDFRENLANMRTYLNITATRLNALSAPKLFPYFNRHVWMTSNIFKDSGVKRSSYYAFYPYSYGVYNSTQARIAMTEFGSSQLDYAGYVAIMNSIVDNLIADEDIGIISGDLRKAYGAENLFIIDSTPVDDYVEPIFSEEVLTQISGATLVGPLKSGSYDICQTYNSYIYTGTYVEGATSLPSVSQLFPIITSNENSSYYHDGFIVNMYKDDVTPDDVMVATRLMACTNYGTDGQTNFRAVILAGSEFIVFAKLAVRDDSTSGLKATELVLQDFSMRSTLAAQVLPQLDWFPQAVFNLDSSATTEYYYYVSDLSNYAVIGPEQLRNMHMVALLSLFSIPEKGMR